MKTLITILLIIPGFSNAFAQEIARVNALPTQENAANFSPHGSYDSILPKNFRFQYGIEVMPTISTIEVNSMPDGIVQPLSPTITYNYGAFFTYNFSTMVGLRTEVLYSTVSQQYQDRMLDRNLNLNYVNIPLLLSFNTGVSDPLNINFVTGPQIGINTGKSMVSTGPTIIGETRMPDGVLAPDKLYLSVVYGLGFDFSLNSRRTTRLGFGYRGSIGVTDAGDNASKLSANEYSILDHSQTRTYSLYSTLSFAF